MKKVIATLTILALTGCASNMTVGKDYATLSGSPEGLRSMFDGMNGMIVNAKASPDKKTAHTIMRAEQEREITKREMTPSFLSNLFSRNSASNVTNVDATTPTTLE